MLVTAHEADINVWQGFDDGLKGPAWGRKGRKARCECWEQGSRASLESAYLWGLLPAPAQPGPVALVSLPHNCAECKRRGHSPGSVECWETPQWRAHVRRIHECKRPGDSWLVRVDGERLATVPTACHSRWHDGCRPSRAEEQLVRLLDLKAFHPDYAGWKLYILTLTLQAVDGRWARDVAWLKLWDRWARFRSRMRHAGVELGLFVAVVETHKSGWPHMHIVLLCPPPGRHGRAQARKHWRSLGGGKIFQWAEIRANPFYVCKYLNKAKGFPETLKALLTVHQIRLTNASPGLLPAKELKPLRWRRMSREGMREYLSKQGAESLLESDPSPFGLKPLE